MCLISKYVENTPLILSHPSQIHPNNPAIRPSNHHHHWNNQQKKIHSHPKRDSIYSQCSQSVLRFLGFSFFSRLFYLCFTDYCSLCLYVRPSVWPGRFMPLQMMMIWMNCANTSFVCPNSKSVVFFGNYGELQIPGMVLDSNLNFISNLCVTTGVSSQIR